MSSFSGKQGRGAGRKCRKDKRVEAEQRSVATAPERRKAFRLGEVGSATRAEANRLLGRAA